MSENSDKNNWRYEKSFPVVKAYSVNEVIAAGGPEAFAKKLGKKNLAQIIEELKKFPQDAFLTNEEYEQAMKTLNESK